MLTLVKKAMHGAKFPFVFRYGFAKKSLLLFLSSGRIIIINTLNRFQTDKNRKRGILMNIGMLIIAIIGGVAGFLSPIYLFVSLPAIIIWKIYRCFKYKYSLTD